MVLNRCDMAVPEIMHRCFACMMTISDMHTASLRSNMMIHADLHVSETATLGKMQLQLTQAYMQCRSLATCQAQLHS